MDKVIIEFYRKDVYGRTLEYVADPEKAKFIAALTRQKTLDPFIRDLFRIVMDGKIEFKEVLPPRN